MKQAAKFGMFAFLVGGPVLLIRILFILVPLFFLSGVVPLIMNRTSEAPDIERAPWAVQTYSYINGQSLPLRTYYAEEYSVVDGDPAIAGYWYYDGKRYVKHNEIKTFPEDIWGPVTVVRRPT